MKHTKRIGSRLLSLLLAVALVLALVLIGAGGAVYLRSRSLPGGRVSVPDYVEKDYLTANPWSRPETPLKKIDGVVIHYVGNPGTTARANRNYFESLSRGRIRCTPVPILWWDWRVR